MAPFKKESTDVNQTEFTRRPYSTLTASNNGPQRIAAETQEASTLNSFTFKLHDKAVTANEIDHLLQTNRERETLFRLDEREASHFAKVLDVKRRYRTASFQRGCCYDYVIEANHLSSRLQFGPNASVFIGGLLRIREDRQGSENGLKVLLAARPVGTRGTFHPMPKLSDGYCGNFESLIRERCDPCLEIERALLASDNDVRIQNYCH